MKNDDAARRHLDGRFTKMGSPALFSRPLKGWVRAIRDALGLSTTQLAKRLEVPQSRVVAIEQGEVAGSLTLNTLSRVADALDCQLVYALVPKQNLSLAKIVELRAYEKAKAVLLQADHTMSLEDQTVQDKEQAAQLERLAFQFKHGSPRKLWRDA